jgi:glycerophosphoryl diester phosphodiesterase
VATTTRPRTGFRFLDDGLEEGTVLAFAHRGGALHPETPGPENTLKAFEHAVGLGYRYLETDVHATSDGVLLAFHDPTLLRLTGRAGRLADATYAALESVLVDGREPIPRLADLMDAFPDVRFNVDLKAGGAVEPMARLVRGMRCHDRVCVGSFTERHLRRFRRLVDRPVATSRGVLAVGASLVPGGRLVGLLLRDPGVAYQVPQRHRRVTVVDRRFVERAHRAGHPVHVWTVDEPERMHDLLDLGVDGLITDRTDVLRDVLVERGQWGGPA